MTARGPSSASAHDECVSVGVAALALMLATGACTERGPLSTPPSVSASEATDGGDAAPRRGSSRPPAEAPAPSTRAADASDAGAAPAGARAACPASPWSSYGHDPARTSASDGCVTGPLTVAWSYRRKGTCGFKVRPGRILHVAADERALFAALDCGGSPALMRVTPGGEPLWTMSRADYGRGGWPALAGDAVLHVDDGVFLVDRETGKWRGRELDVWGEPLVVGDAFFVDNTFQLDGAGPFVGAFDASLGWRWKASVISPGKGKAVPRTGGIAYEDGVVVHAAAMGAHTVPSLAAHDARTGEVRWLAKRTWPESAPSIAGGRVFTVERWSGESGDRLVARALADGSVQWSERVPWSRGPAPVLVETLVVLHGAEGVRAYERETGALAWTNPTPRRAAYEESATTMAAAKGSRTLVVTSGPRVVLLELDRGAEQWSGVVVSGASPTSPGGVTVERPVVVGRTLYVTSDGALLRLDPG